MRSTSRVAVFFAAVILASVTLIAHHGANLFDTTKAVVLKGTVTKFEWGTPHNQIFFDVKDDKSGEVKHWVASTEPAPVMLERGWTRRSLKEGDQVTVYIFAAKNGATVGNLQKIVLADGKELTAAGPPGTVGAEQPGQQPPAAR